MVGKRLKLTLTIYQKLFY